MANRLAIDKHNIALVADMAVGVDLHLHAAIAEDTFSHDGDHVHAFHLLAGDKGRWFIVRISGAGAYCG